MLLFIVNNFSCASNFNKYFKILCTFYSLSLKFINNKQKLKTRCLFEKGITIKPVK